jgi:hypothetical protein
MSDQLAKELEKRQREREVDLQATIEDTIRRSGPTNSLYWVGVVVGSFLLNLLLLVLLARPQ